MTTDFDKQQFIFERDDPCRVDVFLSEETECTRSRIKKLSEEDLVFVNGKPVKVSYPLRNGDVISFWMPTPKECEILPEDIPFEIVYEDDDLAVINKPQGISVHPANNVYSGTLVNGLLFRLSNLSGINGVMRPGIVHRLDKDTSGLMLVAKNDLAHVALAKQIEEKTCQRIYRAINEGVFKEDSGRIETMIGRSSKDRKMMAVVPIGKRAATNWTVLERFPAHTFCEFRLETGRTHQIRVHSKHLGHPIVGDPVYGFKKQSFALKGQLLHAYSISFDHPRTKERLTFTCEPPDDFKKVLKTLQNTLH